MCIKLFLECGGKKRRKALEQQQNAMIKQLRKGEFKSYNKVISLVSPL